MTRRQAILLPLGGPLVARAETPEVRTAAVPTILPSELRWNPSAIFNGAPILFQSPSLTGDATWLGKTITFRQAPGSNLSTALAGVNLGRRPGLYPLEVGGQIFHVPVSGHDYPSGQIRVPNQFVVPPKAVRARIAEEREFKKRIFAESPAARSWAGPFAPPISSRRTSPFGKRRVYNGTTRGIHQGLDFDADAGTPVAAANSGRVAIARPMYYEGGLVVIDHGEQIFSLYLHLSEFLVKEGAAVSRGQTIGKSGASGRVTGPHLHFGMKWQGIYLDPATLFGLWA